jgi:hypothetical protein
LFESGAIYFTDDAGAGLNSNPVEILSEYSLKQNFPILLILKPILNTNWKVPDLLN